MADVLGGAAAGAAAGSVVPGIGTVAGGVIGGIAGLFGGGKKKRAAPPTPPPPPDPRTYWGGSPEAATLETARYRELGARPGEGARIDTGLTDQSRAEQLYGLGQQRDALAQQRDAMGIARTAATGAVPSAAEIYGGRLIDDTINSQMAMAASARGGPSAVSGAGRQAAFQGALTQQAGARDLAAMRADEMARARDLYGGLTAGYSNSAAGYSNSAAGLRGADFQQAYGQAGFDDANLNRNLDRQKFFEKLGWDTNTQVQDAFSQQTGEANQTWARARQLKLQDEDQEWGKARDVIAGVGSVAGAVAPAVSDIRAKDVYLPVSSDARSKYVYSDERAKDAGPDVVLLTDDPQLGQLQQSGEHAFYMLPPGYDGGRPSLAGDSRPSHLKARSEAPSRSAESAPKRREMTPDEMRAEADRLMAMMRSDHDARMATGPSVIISDPAAKEIAEATGFAKGQAAAHQQLADSRLDSAKKLGAAGAIFPPAMIAAGVQAGRSMSAQMKADKAAEKAYQGTVTQHPWSEDPVANANRAQVASSYTYKPGFAEYAGQQQGEMNVGPMANTMAEDPIAATAVTKDPNTGLLALDPQKLQKLQSAGLASLQNQVDEMRAAMAPRAAVRSYERPQRR